MDAVVPALAPVTARILDHLGLPAAVPPIAPARGPPADDLELPFADF